MNLKEDEYTELKRTTGELNDSMYDISAILNKHGNGTLYFGMKNDGAPNPFMINDSTLRDVSRKIYETIKPQIYPDIHKIIIDGSEVIEVRFSGDDKPYSAFGKYYLRVADESREMTPSELRKMMIGGEYELNWERKISDHLITDIDEETLKRFFTEGVSCGRLPDAPYDKDSLLKRLELTTDDYLNNAGKMLFSVNRPIVLKMAVFATDEKITFLDINRVEGNIFQLIDKAMRYISENTRWKAEIVGLQRIETPEVPLDALREVIINSFAHARYDCPVQHEISIFSNRISITNPGDFANEFSPEEYARKELKSVLRNEIIAKTLYLCKGVETFGSGFKRVYSLCSDADVGISYNRSENFFTFNFYRKNKDVVNDVVIDVVISDDEKTAIKLIEGNPKITAEEIGNKIAKTSRTAQRLLESLKNKGVIERVGSNKSGYWLIRK
ncbi:MAG: RNA-binding domain-containing protein [Saccharofermentanales bacterium]